jgi:enoyl-CoA hydratase/carnithine racemase
MLIHLDFDAVHKTAVIKLNRPEKLNALTFDLAQELVNALDAIEKNFAVRCVIITGEGKAFCAGSDLAARLSQNLPTEGVEGDPYLRALRRVNKRITDLPVPVIAAINGHAIGGGWSWPWHAISASRHKAPNLGWAR